MSVKLKILFVPLVVGFVFLFFSIIYAENGLLDLLWLKEQRKSLKIENSKIGQKLFDEIDIFKRLSKNDLKLIERLARSDLGMIGKDEMVLIPREPIRDLKEGNPKTQDPDNFRILTDDEIDELLEFDIESFKFYEKLKENDEDSSSKQKQAKQNKK